MARRRLLESALEAGILHFDVAPIYGLGLAEGEVGRVLRGHREQVVLATKVGIGLTPQARVLGRVQSPVRKILLKLPSLQQQVRSSAAGPSSGRFGGLLYTSTFSLQAAQRSLDQSLRELGTDYIDLLLLHDPQPSDFKSEEVYDLLERARASGKIRSWGVAGEVEPTSAVIKMFPGPTPVVQIRDDIFRRDEYLAPPAESDFLITFGVLGYALPRILAHVTADKERTRHWSDAVGADCASPDTIVTFLLKDAVRANARGALLYSTTKPERIRSTAALISSVPDQTDASLDVFRQLVGTELEKSEATSKDDQ
ncbi:MAG TPA: aldo/keto reductase [Acidimicrobiales bacterium]|nr:aldo/keto reductase [Acidimicrobiales bacterium]